MLECQTLSQQRFVEVSETWQLEKQKLLRRQTVPLLSRLLIHRFFFKIICVWFLVRGILSDYCKNFLNAVDASFKVPCLVYYI